MRNIFIINSLVGLYIDIIYHILFNYKQRKIFYHTELGVLEQG